MIRAGELEQGAVTGRIIAAAIEVHRVLGPGFIESVYENALSLELESRGHTLKRQLPVSVFYKGVEVACHRLDMLVDGSIVVELKAISALEPIHFAIVRSYLKAADVEHGLLLNFAGTKLHVKRVVREWKRGTGMKRIDAQGHDG